MKIALIGYEANIKNRVGSNQYAYELIKTMHSLDIENDYTVFLPSKPLSDMPAEKNNWHYQVTGPRKLWNIFGLPYSLFFSGKKFDLIFNPGHYCPLFFPAPLVVSIMDLGYLRFPEQFTKPIYWKLRLWTWLSIKRAKHIFAISESTKKDIISQYHINSDKITVTYPGYDIQQFNQKINLNKINLVLNKYQIKKPYLLFMSTLKPNKNIEGLLSAYKIMLEQKPEYQLVIGGRKGWLFEQIYTKVKQLSLEEKVNFTGFVEEIDKPILIQNASEFVLPSFWEGFGIPVVEAMGAGIPVVVSNAGSLPEIVGNAGIIVDPYKPADIARGMVVALENSQDLVISGKEQSKGFTWDNCAQNTIAVLKGLV